MKLSQFINQVKNIVEVVPNQAQICLFSATLPKYCYNIAENFLVDPVKICVKKEQLTLEGIKQYYSYHIDGLREIKSLRVMESILN